MLTTLGKKVHEAFRREPIAFCLTTFLLLAGAGTGMTARQILTAAPAASGAVDLASTTGVEGTGTALMRADATLGVKGILPKANGGTGSSTGAVSLQATTPGTADSGNFNITGRGKTGSEQSTTYYNTDASGYIGNWDATNLQWTAFAPAQGSGAAVAQFDWNTGAPSTNANDNTGIYKWRVQNIEAISINRNARVTISAGNAASNGGIAGGGADGLKVHSINASWASLTTDTGGVAATAGTKLFIVRNNGIEKFSVTEAGNVNFTGSIAGTMAKVGSGTVTLAGFSIAGSACQYHGTTLTVTGAVTSDYCAPVYVGGWGTTAATLHCEVTASNTVSFRFCNNTTAAVGIPVTNSYIAYVMR